MIYRGLVDRIAVFRIFLGVNISLQMAFYRFSVEYPNRTGLGDGLPRILEKCDRLGKSLVDPRRCSIHRDFYADQVLVDQSRLYLIDWDLYCEGGVLGQAPNSVPKLLRTKESSWGCHRTPPSPPYSSLARV